MAHPSSSAAAGIAKNAAPMTSSADADETERFDFVFGFGSIINTETHAPWLADLRGVGEDVSGGLPGRRARLRATFGYVRGWNFRSPTGFTALGLSQATSELPATSINGVVFRIPHSALPGFDKREVGYDRVRVPPEDLELLYASGSESDAAAGSSSNNEALHLYQRDVPFIIAPPENVWIYIPQNSQEADEDHPILQSYVDTVLQGCIEWGGEEMTREFVETTCLWSAFFLNDTPSSRRPWLFRKQYDTIDKILCQYADKTFYAERKHPEEFASTFLVRMMRGTWNLPQRNSVFTGRNAEIGIMHSKFVAQSSKPRSSVQNSQSGVARLKVVGMGGVGKTQICIEYCYRQAAYYGLIIWLSAQSAESISSGYRQLLADTTGADMKDKDTNEVVAEVKARLFRSKVPWLLVFDNLEDEELLDKFVPHGGCGHMLVTTRLAATDDAGLSDVGETMLLLGCFSPEESVQLLRLSLGDHDVSEKTHWEAAERLSEKLGHLPLALGMAAAYMRRCDVACSEYLARYLKSEREGSVAESLGGQAVEASLSLSLDAIKKENPAALDVLRMVSWLGPDHITKSLLRSLIQAKKKYAVGESKSLVGQRSLRVSVQKYALTGGLVMGSLFVLTRASARSTRMAARAIAVCAVTAAAVVATSTDECTNPKKGESCFDRLPAPLPPVARQSTFSADEYETTDAVWNTLKSYSLLLIKDGRGSMHRLLGSALRSSQDKDEGERNLTVCVRVMKQKWSFRPEIVDTWEASACLLEHMKAVVAHVSQQHHHQSLYLETSILAREVGIFSAMALNRFKESQESIELSLSILQQDGLSGGEVDQVRAASLHELGRVLRYEGAYVKSEKALHDALNIRSQLASHHPCARRHLAATLHELGVLEIKKHKLEPAATFLEKAFALRTEVRRNAVSSADASVAEGECASTLHQLAAVHVAQKPPSLDVAEELLSDALSLNMGIGQRAATLKQLARVAIRRGEFASAEKILEQALELYVELYGDSLNHVNVAAVKYQQGALAFQRNDFDAAWSHFTECLQVRRHVYAYSQGNHLEVSTVLHELGCVAFAQRRFTKAEEMLTTEKGILDQLYDASSQRQRVLQARLTNLTWLRKCAKERGNEAAMKQVASERLELKREAKSERQGAASEIKILDLDMRHLKREAVHCRQLSRQFALAQRRRGTSFNVRSLELALASLSRAAAVSPPSALRVASMNLQRTTIDSLSGTPNRSAILEACDDLRDVLRREYGEVVDDSVHGGRPP